MYARPRFIFFRSSGRRLDQILDECELDQAMRFKKGMEERQDALRAQAQARLWLRKTRERKRAQAKRTAEHAAAQTSCAKLVAKEASELVLALGGLAKVLSILPDAKYCVIGYACARTHGVFCSVFHRPLTCILLVPAVPCLAKVEEAEADVQRLAEKEAVQKLEMAAADAEEEALEALELALVAAEEEALAAEEEAAKAAAELEVCVNMLAAA
jgi:hypothetical protein